MKPLVIAGALVGLWVGGLLDSTLAWAEQVELVTYYPSPAALGPPPPAKPYTMYLTIPPNPSGPITFYNIHTYDVYTTLQLWKFGVARSQVQLVDHQILGLQRIGFGPEKRVVYVGHWDQTDPHLIESAPLVFNGALVLERGSIKDPVDIEVTITW